MLVALIVREPLDDNKEVHVPKDAKQEDELWKELMQEFISVLEIDGVESLLDKSKHYVEHSNYHCKLHFERVHENKLLLCPIPDRIHSHRVNTVGVSANSCFCVIA